PQGKLVAADAGAVVAVVKDVAADGSDVDEGGRAQRGEQDIRRRRQTDSVRGAAAWSAQHGPRGEADAAAGAVAVRVGIEDDRATGEQLGAGAQRDVAGAAEVVEIGLEGDGAPAGRG